MAFFAGVSWSDDESHNSNSLDACFLCRKSLGFDSDIFMYRGNTPFCSTECRQEQIEIDELKEKKSWKLQSESSNKDSSTNNTVRTNTVVVA